MQTQKLPQATARGSSADTTREAEEVRILTSEAEAILAAEEIFRVIEEESVRHDAQRSVPFAAFEAIARSGLLGMTVPRAYGGPAVSARTVAHVLRRIASGDPSVAQTFQPHLSALDALDLVGTPEQREFFFAEALSGAWFGNATNEARNKQGQQNFATKAQWVTDQATGVGHYTISGSKDYCTGALTARWIAVMLKDEAENICVAYVRNGATGVSMEPTWNAFGQRATSSGRVDFDDVAVAGWHLLARYKIFEKPQAHGAFGQLHHVAVDLGVLDAVLRDARDYVVQRSRPAAESPYPSNAEDPVVIREFGKFDIQRRAAEALLNVAADRYDVLNPVLLDPSVEPETASAAAAEISLAVAAAKAFASEQAVAISSAFFEFTGAGATDSRFALDRHWRNSRTHTLHDPVRWKIFHLGNHLLNGTPPPTSGIL